MNILRRALGLGFPIWLGMVLAFGAGVAWMSVGGIPRGIDRFGVVQVPGRQVVSLPAGKVLMDHYDDVHGCHEGKQTLKNGSIPALPEDTTVRITSDSKQSGPLRVTRRSATAYVGISGCRGHDPFGQIDVPSAGEYLVAISDSAHNASDQPMAHHGKNSTTGSGISFGYPPWSPLGISVIGAVLAAALVGVAGWGLATLLFGDGWT
jgi:hypothetical protein